MISHDNICLQCSKEFYYSNEEKKCIAILKGQLIENCENYTGAQICGKCNDKFYLQSNKCIQLENQIPNCQIQKSETNCDMCQRNYQLSIDKKNCFEAPDLTDCLYFQVTKCKKCQSGTIYDVQYSQEILQNESNANYLLNITNYFLGNSPPSFPNNFCRNIEIQDCSLIIDYQTCQVCSEGFYLNENNCLAYPKSTIQHCVKYENFNQCNDCDTGYHLTSQNKCEANQEIPFCIFYKTNSLLTECFECDSAYFLKTISLCEQRQQNSIEKCVTYQINQDSCKECEQGSTLTSDNLKCLPEIPQCQTYERSTIKSDKLTCQKCNLTFYLKEEQCVQGTKPFCSEYKTNENDCEVCQEGYYFFSDNCNKHNEINNCELYDKSKKDVCTKCNGEFIPFEIKAMCVNVTSISGCLIYALDATCQTCKLGYKYNAGSCDEISKDLNCLSLQGDNCIKCLDQYININGKCVPIPEYISYGCQETNYYQGITLDQLQCKICKEDHIFYDFTDNSFCINIDFIKNFSSHFSNYNSDIFNTCEKFEIVEDTLPNYKLHCRKCQDGFFLNIEGDVESCVTACPITKILSIKYLEDQFKCIDRVTATQNCELINFNSAGGYVCSKCKPDFISELHDYIGNPLISHDFNWNNKYFQHPFEQFNFSVNCKEFELTDGGPPIFLQEPDNYIKKVDHCQYYQKIYQTNLTQSTKYGCIQCKNGYIGKKEQQGPLTHIGSCVLPDNDLNCITQPVPGVDKHLSAFIQCYGSYSIEVIPTTYFFISSNVIKGFTDTVQMENDLVSNAKGMNCALINQDPVANLIECLACKKGYKPTYVTTSGRTIAISNCTKITNCKNSEWFNSCSQCDNGFTYQIQGGNIDYQNCHQFTDENCYYFKDNTTSKDCQLCKKGYFLNQEKICDKIQVSNCDNYANLFSTQQTATTYYYIHNYQGCEKCYKNHVQLKYNSVLDQKTIFLNFPRNQCIKSQYIASKSVYGGVFKNNCKYYTLNFKCSKCQKGYILINESGECKNINEIENALKNCEQAYSLTKCMQCFDTHVFESELCVPKTIVNCKDYLKNPALESQLCIQCIDGYYLDQNVCKLGLVKDCLVYGNGPKVCNKCDSLYQLIVDYQGSNYCYPFSETMKCQEYNSKQFQDGNGECNSCLETESYKLTNNISEFPASICLPFKKVDFCKNHDVLTSFSNSSMLCEECISDYYQQNGICIERTKTISSCKKYKNNADQCEVCEDDYFLFNNNEECVPFPNGIENCKLYLDNKTCIGCIANHYLTSNKCEEVQTLINSCLYYTDSNTCSQCNPSFLLNGNQCEEITALNCLTYLSPSQCATCSSDRGLKEESGKINCVFPEDSNCLNFSSNHPFTCYQCKSGFFIDEETKLCVKITQPIENCSLYEKELNCSSCKKGYVLSLDKSKCENSSLINLDQKCDDIFASNEYTCSLCGESKFLDKSGKCQQCLAENCFLCNSEKSQLCELCKSGYQMTSDSTCIVNDKIQVIQPTEDKEEDKKNGFILLVKLLALYFVMQ